MLAIRCGVRLFQRQSFTVKKASRFRLTQYDFAACGSVDSGGFSSMTSNPSSLEAGQVSNLNIYCAKVRPSSFQCGGTERRYGIRFITSAADSAQSTSQSPSSPVTDAPPRIKFKRLDKTARNIMKILDKEAVDEVKAQREIPDIRPGYIVQLKVEVPENKRRISIVKGIVIARRNAGLSTTFRIRRLVAGVGVESLFQLYSPNLKEIKVLEKKKVRRAKLYYLRDKMNALK